MAFWLSLSPAVVWTYGDEGSPPVCMAEASCTPQMGYTIALFAWAPIMHSLLMVVVLHGGAQGRHEEYEQQHRTKLQQEEEAARRAAEFKVWLPARLVPDHSTWLTWFCRLLHGLMQMATVVEHPPFHHERMASCWVPGTVHDVCAGVCPYPRSSACLSYAPGVQARPIAPTGPFVVHESDAALTVPEDLQLATDTRAAGRAEFDAHMAEKMQQEEVGAADGTPSLPHAS